MLGDRLMDTLVPAGGFVFLETIAELIVVAVDDDGISRGITLDIFLIVDLSRSQIDVMGLSSSDD